MIQNLHLLILLAVVILALVNLYIGKVFFKQRILFKVQSIYLIFIILHCVYVAYYREFDFIFVNIGAPFSLFYGPFFYSNIQAANLGSRFKIKKAVKHFLLGLIFFVVFLMLYIGKEQLRHYFTYYTHLLYIVTCLQLIYYAVLIYLKFNNVAKGSKMVAFMNQSILIMIVSILVFSGLIFRDKTQELSYIKGSLVYVLMLLIVILILRYNLIVILKKLNFYKSFSKKEFFNKDQKKKIKLGKYYKSKISKDEMTQDIKLLEKLLNDGIYLISELTLEILAKKLNISTHRLSQVFTMGMDSNFNKVINSYRIQHAVELLGDLDSKDTIEEIGLKSGFNSRASFYRAFNVSFNMTPSDFRKKGDLQ